MHKSVLIFFNPLIIIKIERSVFVMTIEEKLKSLIIDNYGSVNNFSKTVGVTNSTVASVLTRGIQNASLSTVFKICKALNISADELSKGKIVFAKTSSANFETLMENTRKNVIEQGSWLDGKELTVAELNFIFGAVDMAVAYIRRNRSEE